MFTGDTKRKCQGVNCKPAKNKNFKNNNDFYFSITDCKPEHLNTAAPG